MVYKITLSCIVAAFYWFVLDCPGEVAALLLFLSCIVIAFCLLCLDCHDKHYFVLNGLCLFVVDLAYRLFGSQESWLFATVLF